MQVSAAMPRSSVYFAERYAGTFYGVLKWSELDELWGQIKRQLNSAWFIYDLNVAPPDKPVTEAELSVFITHMDDWLRKTHAEDYCGVVYVDDKINPSYVKIFHPKKMGYGTCSLSKESPLPGWILSTLKLVELNPQKASRPVWWKSLSILNNQL